MFVWSPAGAPIPKTGRTGLLPSHPALQEHTDTHQKDTDTDQNRDDSLKDGAERALIRGVIGERGVEGAEQGTDHNHEHQEPDDFVGPARGFLRNSFSPSGVPSSDNT